MIGAGDKGQWFYRGDSIDIIADTKLLHRQPDPSRPQFGARLRCSGCHTNGGMIMKEIEGPHNDWWTELRHLPLGPNRPDAEVSGLLTQLVDAKDLAQAVQKAQTELFASPKYQAALGATTLQEQLRPLFCPVEMNIASDLLPLDAQNPDIQVHSAFFVDPILATSPQLKVKRNTYVAALQSVRSAFPETGQLDADHGWLTPVKAESDHALVQLLIKKGVIDSEFVADVLGVDMTNPVVSPARCGLLKLLPNTKANPVDFRWQNEFLATLRSSSNAAAKELAQNISEHGRNVTFHHFRATQYLSACKSVLDTGTAVPSLVRLLGQRRAEVFASEISKNPQGQIFEPGFRVIFPKMQPTPQPQALQLSDTCLIQ